MGATAEYRVSLGEELKHSQILVMVPQLDMNILNTIDKCEYTKTH